MVRLTRWPVALALVAFVAGCPQPRKRRTTDGVTASGNDTFPADFTPPPPMPPAPGADPKAFGAAYLDQLAVRVEDGWTQFLEDCRLRLPPSHPLNSATLEATVNFVIDAHGGVIEARVVAPSGNTEFDDAVASVAADAGPFPAADRTFLSDDDHAYVTWLFARDRRQAGAATARLDRVEWSLEQAVPKFLADGNLSEAAHRVGKVAAAGPNPIAVGFGERVMAAAIREGLASPDASVQRQAIAGAAAGGIKAAARELRAIGDGAMDVGLRGVALDALATIGDVDAVPLLLTILERDAGANIELTAAAARALSRLGAGAELAARVRGWFDEGKAGKTGPERAKVWAALIATSGGAVPTAIPELGRQVAASEPRVRAAACRSLGTTAVVDGAAWKPLGRGLKDADASVRAACVTAIADAAAAGGRSRATWWLVEPLLRDRDDRVRSGAALALTRLDSARARASLALLARDKSALVQAALAEAAARVGDLDGAAARLSSDNLAIRVAAATALASVAGDAGRARLAGHVDADPSVRAIVVGVLPAGDALTAAAADPDPAVVVEAKRRAIIVGGRTATLATAAETIATAASASAVRVQVASAWLAAR